MKIDKFLARLTKKRREGTNKIRNKRVNIATNTKETTKENYEQWSTNK